MYNPPLEPYGSFLNRVIADLFIKMAGEPNSRYTFNGLGMGLGNLSRLSHAKTRSISAENLSGEKGQAGKAIEGTVINIQKSEGSGSI